MNHFFYLSTPLIVSLVIAFIALLIVLLIEYTGITLNRKRFLIALFLSSLCAAIMGTFGINQNIYEGLWYFLLIHFVFGAVGSWLTILLRRNYFSDAPKENYVNYILLIALLSFSYVIFSIVFNFFALSNIGYHYASAIFAGLVPILFIPAFQHFASIPPPVYKVWYIDESREEPDFEDVNIKNIMLTSLDIIKNVNDEDFTNIKIKAPLNMKFADWFQSFVLSYNEKYPESEIQYKYLDGTFMGWIFYIRPRFLGRKKYIEPNKSFQKNLITEKQTVVAERAKYTY